jgi:hypothetical protein
MSLADLGVLQIEPTDQCNLRCTMCAPHHEGWETIHNVPKGFLSVSLWQKIVDGFVEDDLRFDHIIFQWLGDPLLHPEIIQLISLAASRLFDRVKYLRLDTNAILLTKERVHALCTIAQEYSIPILLVCTLDAHTPSVYKFVKGGDHLLLVRRNIQYLLMYRASIGKDCLLNVQIQFVVQNGNSHECYSFLHYWVGVFLKKGGEWHDELMFKRLSVGGGAKGQAEADELYERSVTRSGISPQKYGNIHVLCWENRPWQHDDAHSGKRKACPALWMTPVIRHDGALMMCCADLGGGLRLGSLQEAQFAALWFGEKAEEKRHEHQNGVFSGVCKSCGGVNWYTLSKEKILLLDEKAKELREKNPKEIFLE